MILGVVLAGGASRRFGSDKAIADYRGRPLIEHALARLAPFATELVVSGGERPGYRTIPDRPTPGLGPLGGLYGALAHARAGGFETVLTIPCDTPDLSADAISALLAAQAPAYLAALPVAGWWRARDDQVLLARLSSREDRSMRGWARACGATPVETPAAVRNINRPEDLLAAERDGITC